MSAKIVQKRAAAMGESPHSGGLPFLPKMASSQMAAPGSLAYSGKCSQDTHRIYLRSAQ